MLQLFYFSYKVSEIFQTIEGFRNLKKIQIFLFYLSCIIMTLCEHIETLRVLKRSFGTEISKAEIKSI